MKSTHYSKHRLKALLLCAAFVHDAVEMMTIGKYCLVVVSIQ